jgi:hypothetical protein
MWITRDALAFRRVGAAHAPSPDVRCAHPGLRSLGGGWRSGILPTLATYAGSRGMGSPSRIIAGRSWTTEPLHVA